MYHNCVFAFKELLSAWTFYVPFKCRRRLNIPIAHMKFSMSPPSWWTVICGNLFFQHLFLILLRTYWYKYADPFIGYRWYSYAFVILIFFSSLIVLTSHPFKHHFSINELFNISVILFQLKFIAYFVCKTLYTSAFYADNSRDIHSYRNGPYMGNSMTFRIRLQRVQQMFLIFRDILYKNLLVMAQNWHWHVFIVNSDCKFFIVKNCGNNFLWKVEITFWALKAISMKAKSLLNFSQRSFT